MHILVTGAAGFFGLALTKVLACAGHAVLAADAVPGADFSPRQGTPTDRLRYVSVDVSDRAALAHLPAENVEAVVHAAALTPTPQQQLEDPERIVDINLGGTTNLLAFARKAPRCSKFLYVSSAGVFAQSLAAILREDDATGGASLYGATKIASEHLVRRYGQMFNLQVAIVRPTSLYGPGEQPRPSRPNVTAVRRLVSAALHGERIRVQGREARCDWLYVDDAAQVVCRLMDQAPVADQVFNLSSGFARPFGEIVDVIAALTPLQIDEQAEEVIDGGPDRPATIANERLRSTLGWQPRDLVSGIREYVASMTERAGDDHIGQPDGALVDTA